MSDLLKYNYCPNKDTKGGGRDRTVAIYKGCSHHHHIVPGITGPQAATMGPGEVVGNIIDHHETMEATEIIEYEYDPCHTIVLATENDWNVTVCELIS